MIWQSIYLPRLGRCNLAASPVKQGNCIKIVGWSFCDYVAMTTSMYCSVDALVFCIYKSLLKLQSSLSVAY